MTDPLITWSLAAGEDQRLVVRAEIAPGWHLYPCWPQPVAGVRPTTIALAPGSPHALTGPIVEPAPSWVLDPGFGAQVAVHEGTVEFSVGVESDAAAPVVLSVSYQLCSDDSCMPLADADLTLVD